jgi:predicted nucleic acid-binding protein
MNILADTNILARTVEPGHTQSPLAINAVTSLRAQGHMLCIEPQVIYEFWVVCTRPVAVNGLGKTAAEASNELANLKSLFVLYDDTAQVLVEWERLVTNGAVLGKNAHDARLVAAMLAHGIGGLLTFNAAHFGRYSSITVLTPQDVLAPPSSPSP